MNKSEIYQAVLPLINSSRVRLLDNHRLAQQLAGLERRTGRGGRDSIDHSRGGHDDIANAVSGALVLAASEKPKMTADQHRQILRYAATRMGR